MDNEALLAKIKFYETWAKRIALLTLVLVSVILGYRYAYKRGQIDALEQIIRAAESHNDSPSHNLDNSI